ncbi:16S rRNA m(2)G-966 methyltransferase [Oceanospirillum multiglobuliferum]|uniref:Ribosomal RNA small subunit methyltransferase D n=1 Tax=Oceanospirillum multiglobuliferum TaxID=64969 RepID=A0A1T4NNE8_9GAMM|nr:16S rRNA (guanine(966)-N(2))-methyltransferase RsmD [Oceanospirillum multiglobuliferum]OPX55743.1 16S rRNA (guanine(966)-N(2))-methyltransferase RsmD [Oceanospirillum multiglobuliferum]SJZ80586.1 16S rRNA m(2)G-966 methyltransferase [Oceanospirillum multiglobuliferum]
MPKPNSKSSATSQTAGRGQNQLRIIAGEWRGRKLSFPDGEGLRPTGDRLRETLFNWLAYSVSGAKVLDLFAGSGALGFEALSRGAASAVFLDTYTPVVRQLRQNLEVLKCTQAEVHQTDALSWLSQSKAPASPFNLIFLDPPFGKGLLAPVCATLEQKGWLADDAWIYLEAEKDLALSDIPSSWQLRKEKKAGQVICRLYRRDSAPIE